MTSNLYKKVNNQKEDIFENTSNDTQGANRGSNNINNHVGNTDVTLQLIEMRLVTTGLTMAQPPHLTAHRLRLRPSLVDNADVLEDYKTKTREREEAKIKVSEQNLTEWSVRRRGGGGNMRDYCVDEILCDIFAVKPHTEETMKKHFSIFDKITEEFLEEWQSC